MVIIIFYNFECCDSFAAITSFTFWTVSSSTSLPVQYRSYRDVRNVCETQSSSFVQTDLFETLVDHGLSAQNDLPASILCEGTDFRVRRGVVAHLEDSTLAILVQELDNDLTRHNLLCCLGSEVGHARHNSAGGFEVSRLLDGGDVIQIVSISPRGAFFDDGVDFALVTVDEIDISGLHPLAQGVDGTSGRTAASDNKSRLVVVDGIRVGDVLDKRLTNADNAPTSRHSSVSSSRIWGA
ncbi:hypothetical protein CaCOL14_009602 [Colletotrichum acutatum]